MNVKRFLIAAVAVFIVGQFLEYLLHGVFLRSLYESTQSIWRPDMMDKMWMFRLSGLITSFLLTYIFVKGYEGKGLGEGLRFGMVLGLFVSVPMALCTYAMIAIPPALAVGWFLGGFIGTVILGLVLAAIYKK
ncbi:MAG: hypothetical protein V1798_03440 [Pseudomonadota bacterium]